MVSRQPPANHDHSSTGSGGDELKPKQVDADEPFTVNGNPIAAVDTVNGKTGDVTVDAGTDAFTTESGSFTKGGSDAGTQTVSFTNTYDPDTIMWGISTVTDSGDRTDPTSAAFAGWQTDGNGDITGMDIDWSHGVASATTHWNIMGAPV